MSIYLENLCWMEFLPKCNSRGRERSGWNKKCPGKKILKNSLARGRHQNSRHQTVYIMTQCSVHPPICWVELILLPNLQRCLYEVGKKILSLEFYAQH